MVNEYRLRTWRELVYHRDLWAQRAAAEQKGWVREVEAIDRLLGVVAADDTDVSTDVVTRDVSNGER